MKRITTIFILLFTISEVHLILTEEKRQDLLNKLTKKISLDELNKIENTFDYSNTLKDPIDYNPTEIAKIISDYGFPESYNFIEETNATVHIKDQAYCGCCWSHAATTSLAYRYHKIGIEVDLSPQDALSCYLRDCLTGNNLIDPELNLIKNGTVTEGCLPFSSGDGKTIESCPTSCKDGTEFKKYYAKNAYMTSDYYSKDTFKEIVILMMDQLINDGPIVTGIRVYDDFYIWSENHKKCHDDVYTYDGISEEIGGHAVVIVGYGFLNNKYYWLIQNSWGKDSCDNGFAKIEFGQITIERVAFAQPYIPNEEATPQELPISFNSLDTQCNLNVFTTSSHENWKNTLEVNFKHSKGIKDFNFQCAPYKIPTHGNLIKCYYEIEDYSANRGLYEFKGLQSLGTENEFKMDDTFNNRTFNFWGLDYIEAYNYPLFIVSEVGKRITFPYEATTKDILPPIYPDKDSKNPFKNCKKLNNLPFIYCDIDKDEFDELKDVNDDSANPAVYGILCGYKNPFIFVLKNTKNYFTSFTINKFNLPEIEEIANNTLLTVIAKVGGTIYDFDLIKNSFIVIAEAEKNNKNTTLLMHCYIKTPSSSGKNIDLPCHFLIDKGNKIKYDNLYLLPYYMVKDMEKYYEVIIKGTIKATKGGDDEDDDHSYDLILNKPCLMILALLLLILS